MKTSEDLFELIQAMNSHEKGYFRRYASLHVRGEKNKYILLFEAIARQKKYDEEKLKKKFYHEKFVKQFPVAKNYLYSQILKALRAYHYSIHSEINNLQHEAEILIEKGLYKQARKVLRKAKKIAREGEMLWSAPETASEWEIRLAVADNDMEELKNLIAEKSNDFHLLQNAEAYRDINFRIFILYSAIGRMRERKHLDEMKKIMKQPLLKHDARAYSFEAKLRFYLTHALWADTKGNVNEYYDYSEKIIELFKSNPENIPYRLSQYIAYYGNLIAAAVNSGSVYKAGVYLKELGQLSVLLKNDMLRHKLFYYYSHLTLYYFNTMGRFPTKTDNINDIAEKVINHQKYLSDIQKSILFSNLVTAFFIQQQYHKSIFWLNRIRNEISLHNYPNIQSYLHVFYLIVNYEAGKTELLPYLVQSTYRFLRKKEQLYKFETCMIDFIKKIPDAYTSEKLQAAFRKFYSQIMPLTKDPFEKNAFEYFDYVSWLKSKIEGRNFAEVVKEKADRTPA